MANSYSSNFEKYFTEFDPKVFYKWDDKQYIISIVRSNQFNTESVRLNKTYKAKDKSGNLVDRSQDIVLTRAAARNLLPFLQQIVQQLDSNQNHSQTGQAATVQPRGDNVDGLGEWINAAARAATNSCNYWIGDVPRTGIPNPGRVLPIIGGNSGSAVAPTRGRPRKSGAAGQPGQAINYAASESATTTTKKERKPGSSKRASDGDCCDGAAESNLFKHARGPSDASWAPSNHFEDGNDSDTRDAE